MRNKIIWVIIIIHNKPSLNLTSGSDHRVGGGGDSLELAEDVCVLGRDAVGLQHGDPEGEQAADLQVLQGAPQRGVQRGLGLRLRLLRPSWAGGGEILHYI